MMQWLIENMAEGLIVVGLALLAIEILILGFSTFIMFFIGIGTLITGTLMVMGAIETTSTNALIFSTLFTALTAILTWRPLKKMQSDVDTTQATNDLVGHSFVLTDAVSATDNPEYKFSGIAWKLVSEQPLEANTKVEVVKVDVGIFHIQASK